MAKTNSSIRKTVATDHKKSFSGAQNIKPNTGSKPSGGSSSSSGNTAKKK